MEFFIKWMNTNQYAVPIVAGIIIAIVFVIKTITGAVKRAAAQPFYDVAAELDLKVVMTSSGRGMNVPRLVGFYIDRNVEITGFQRTIKTGATLDYVRIKMAHKGYVVRSIHMEYNALNTPPLQKLLIEGKREPMDVLLEMEAFDEETVDKLATFVQTYSQGRAVLPSVFTFGIDDVSYDREPLLVGDKNHILNCLKDLREILMHIERKTG